MNNFNPNASQKVVAISPEGQWQTLDPSEVTDAVQRGGYKIPSSDEIQTYNNEQKYGSGVLNPTLAFLAGAARTPSLGASDWLLTKGLGVKPETLQGLSQANPGMTTAGELTGAGGALLIPGLGEEAGALEAADLLNPLKAAQKAGHAITESLAPVAQENAPLVSRILSQAPAHALGSAVEGLAYGAGQTISEAALGDPELNAEKVMSNLGFSALIAGGLGGALGILKKPITSEALSAAEPLAEEATGLTPKQALEQEGFLKNETPFQEAVDLKGRDPETQESILEGLKKKKENAADIVQAANELGAPVPEGMISDSKQIQRLESMLVTSPTPVGVARQQLYQEGLDKAAKATGESIGEGVDLSRSDLSKQFKEGFTQAFEEKAAPSKELYNVINQHFPHIEISERARTQWSNSIRKIINDESLVKGTPEYSLVDNFSEGINEIDNLGKLKNFRKALNRARTKENSFAVGLIRDKLDNFEANTLQRTAESLPEGEPRDLALKLIDAHKEARAAYSELRDKMTVAGKGLLGKRKIYGPEDFIDAVNEQKASRFAKLLFNEQDNTQFLNLLQKEFPNELGLLAQYQRALIKEAATKNGQLVPKLVFKQVAKLSKEVKNIVFTLEELQKLKAAETYLDAMPGDWNPSHTSSMEAYRRFFSNPISATLETTRDFGAKKLIEHFGQSNVEGLSKLERATQKVGNSIESAAKSVFKATTEHGASLVPLASNQAYQALSRDDHHELVAKINQLNNDPEGFVNALENATQDIYHFAPDLSQSLQTSAVRATQFLASKLPKQTPSKPLSGPFQPSQSEIATFGRYYRAVENPVGVLSQIKDGSLTSQEVEALSSVYPRLYQEMKSTLLDHLSRHVSSKNADNIPYRTKMALSLFLGEDLVDSLNGHHIALNQMALTTPGGQQASPVATTKTSAKGLQKLNRASSVLTDSQANANRE